MTRLSIPLLDCYGLKTLPIVHVVEFCDSRYVPSITTILIDV